MKLNLDSYREDKPHRLRRLIWLFVNTFVLPYVWHDLRRKIMRIMGAQLDLYCSIYRTIKIFSPLNLVVGHHVCLGPDVEIYNKAPVKIGNNVVVSQCAWLCTASHDISSPTMDLVTEPITIKDNVWVGARAIILPGVTIGEGAVVGACAVVAKDVPPWSVVVGNPARVVGKRELHGSNNAKDIANESDGNNPVL